MGTHSEGGGGGRGEERSLLWCKAAIPGEGTSGITCSHPLVLEYKQMTSGRKILMVSGGHCL